VIPILRISTRNLILICVSFFSIIAVASFGLSTAPSGASAVYSINTFDLFYSVSWLTWLSIFGLGGLLIVLLMKDLDGVSQRFSFGIMIFILLTIFIVFFGMPYVVEPLPRYWDAWIHGSAVQSLLDVGHLTASADFSYLNYPGSFLFLSAISLITGVDVTTLLHVFPLVFIFVFFFFMLYAFREITGNPKATIIATLIYGLSTYYLAFSFTPAIFGWLLFFIFIALFAKQAQLNSFPSKSRSFFIITLSILFSIGMTHPVTQALTLLATSFLFIFRKKIWQNGKLTLSLVLLTASIFAAWAIFFGFVYYSGIVNSFKVLFNAVFSDLSQSNAVAVFSNSLPAQVSNLIFFRRLLYVFVPVTAFFGLVLTRKKAKQTAVFLVALLCAGAFLAVATIFGALPVERSIELAFIPLSVFSAFLILKNKKVGIALLIFLVATIPINFASYYWDEPFPMTHSWELSGGKFVADNFNGTILSDYKEYLIMSYYHGEFTGVYNEAYYGNIYNASFVLTNNIQLVYVNPLGMLKISYSVGETNINFSDSLNFDCIYSDSYSTVLINSNYPNYTTPIIVPGR
jgi:hypothetical protein